MSDSERRKRDFAAGYLMGLAGMPLASTPEAASSDPLYLYGGVALPPLPSEWDRETYPYAVIVKDKTHQYRLCCYKSINYRTILPNTSLETAFFGTTEDGTAIRFVSRPGEPIWSQEEDTYWDFEVKRGTTSNVAIWTHGFDLMYSDNTLYVAASRPERIADWDALKGKYFYNHLIAPDVFGANYLPDYHNSVIIKTEEAYILFTVILGLGGGTFFIVDNSTKKVYLRQYETYDLGAHRMELNGGDWTRVDFEQCLGEEYEREGTKYWYICELTDLIWTHDDIIYFEYPTGATAFAGTEPVPVPEPPEVIIDNKAIMLGCRLGYIVRSQMGKSDADVPMGVLISSDGYILKDSNGLYLIAKEDS